MHRVDDGQQALLLFGWLRCQRCSHVIPVVVVGYVAVGKPVGMRFFRLRAIRSAPATAQTAYDQQQDDDENTGHQADDDGQRLFDPNCSTQDTFAAATVLCKYET